ncbi:unnamed protein product, partial [Polarella glacialis]
ESRHHLNGWLGGRAASKDLPEMEPDFLNEPLESWNRQYSGSEEQRAVDENCTGSSNIAGVISKLLFDPTIAKRNGVGHWEFDALAVAASHQCVIKI